MTLSLKIWVTIVLVHTVWSKLDCDPNSSAKKPDPGDVASYLYCNLEGVYARRSCVEGKEFNAKTLECELSARHSTNAVDDDPTLHALFQAPDDLCGVGVALTRLSAPVVCNPSVSSSCPRGYECTLYARSGQSFCCRQPEGGASTLSILCALEQVTFLEPRSGRPRSCALNRAESCPVGFGCNVVRGAVMRCCGQDFGCPPNSAGFVQPGSGTHLQCSPDSSSSCPRGFFCARSTLFNAHVCCSKTTSETAPSEECPGEELPEPCSASAPCPADFLCRNGRCCPAKGLCPAGMPFGGRATSCGPQNPCPDGFECVTRSGEKFCCPAPEHVCLLSWNAGTSCPSTRPSVRRFYFDGATGSCRSFQFSQCGGNANNFETVEQCEGFCLEAQCPSGVGFRVASSVAHCSPSSPATCPPSHVCLPARFGTHHVCCPSTEDVCAAGPFSAGIRCFSEVLTIQRFYFDAKTTECRPFEFFGCGATHNNFISLQECTSVCVSRHDHVCEGVPPLRDPSGAPQDCAGDVACPAGYSCREGFCCPSKKLVCSSPKTASNACIGAQRTFWVFDAAAGKCVPFYGCANKLNHFADAFSCERYCLASEVCPEGMVPRLRSGRPASCTLNLPFSCPDRHSCVRSPRSGSPVCCKWKAECPRGRRPFLIPGSDSQVACRLNAPSCPAGSECLQSSTVPNYGICCVRGAASVYNSWKFCPSGLLSNGQKCAVNAPGECPSGFVCIGRSSEGFCCKTGLSCASQATPYFVVPRQALLCDRARCPSGTICAASNVASVRICCRPSVPSKTAFCPAGGMPFFEEGIRRPKQCLSHVTGECPRSFECQASSNGLFYCCPVVAAPSCPKGMLPSGSQHECFMNSANCPSGFSCEGTSARSVCCPNPALSARCPSRSTPYLYLGRPLQCPVGSTACPSPFRCVASSVPQVHLCCTEKRRTDAQCLRGVAYEQPLSGDKIFCSPMQQGQCPLGFTCRESTVAAQFLCCSADFSSQRFEGFCPVGQIPYMPQNSRTRTPPACHMVLAPCPTDRVPYSCIYSAEKQNSFCCAPIESSLRFSRPRPSRCEAPSRPLVDGSGRPTMCDASTPCPPPFECRRSVCCSPLNPSGVFPPPAPATPLQNPAAPLQADGCPREWTKVGDKCERQYFVGQKGCTADIQCSLSCPDAKCIRGYCGCPAHKLIHRSSCVSHCPLGFIDIAGRCRDLTTVVFMDSVSDRANGTIGGFCLPTVVFEEQCIDVDNAFCDSTTITCQCKPGFELKMDFEDKGDPGRCAKLDDSKFGNETLAVAEVNSPPNDDTLPFDPLLLQIDQPVDLLLL
ncbi:hypothetical protein QR680_017376 [Steinernema hermaphroditum]|uniref:BPTI/Kunitz inhibitor domain-containing protein n=1 Tax=Steinernema hermaphroditum TaxID=289476 RepID=A0AA39HEB9_9BILA|nr:hypothetical protein QR680_017376 [Steinernema hermaphroditum]